MSYINAFYTLENEDYTILSAWWIKYINWNKLYRNGAEIVTDRAQSPGTAYL